MLNETKYYCPECDEGFDLPKIKSRREFLLAAGGAAAVAALATTPCLLYTSPSPRDS